MDKNIKGYKYFVDIENDKQYAVSFILDAITMFMGIDTKTGHELTIDELTAKKLIMIDDETKELYTIQLKKDLKGIGILELDKIEVDGESLKVDNLPEKHSNGASLARSKVAEYKQTEKALMQSKKTVSKKSGM